MTGIVEFLTARLDEDQAVAMAVEDNSSPFTGEWINDDGRALRTRNRWVLAYKPDAGPWRPGVLDHIARHDPARVLREVEAKRRIVELHATGSYRTYQCSNGDHIQEWQCERAKEPYTEDRYCEVCGGSECVELPLLAALYELHPDYNPAWRMA